MDQYKQSHYHGALCMCKKSESNNALKAAYYKCSKTESAQYYAFKIKIYMPKSWSVSKVSDCSIRVSQSRQVWLYSAKISWYKMQQFTCDVFIIAVLLCVLCAENHFYFVGIILCFLLASWIQNCTGMLNSHQFLGLYNTLLVDHPISELILEQQKLIVCYSQ